MGRRLSNDRSPLSRDEERMLTLFANGLTKEQVAAAMACSRRLIGYRLTHAFGYTDSRNVTAAVAEGLRRGWIE